MRIAGGLPPFSPIFHWLLERNPSPIAIALFAHLHHRADWETGSAEVSTQELATALRFNKRDSVRPYLNELVELGALEINEQRDPVTGGRIANEYVLILTPARSSGQGATRSSGQPPARSTGQLPISPDASIQIGDETTKPESLPGLEPPSKRKATKPRGEVRADVDRVSEALCEELSTKYKISARVDANTRRTIRAILDRPDTSEAEVLATIAWSFSETCWWRGKLLSVRAWAGKFEQLRAKMLTEGPAAAPEPTLPAGADPFLAVGGEFEQSQRAQFLLVRGIDPMRFFDDGRDRVALLARARRMPVIYDRSGEPEMLLAGWESRGWGPSYVERVPRWTPIPV